MPTEYQIKKLLLDSLRQTVSNQTLSFIAKTKKPKEKEYDLIAVRNVSYLLTPRAYEKLKNDWEWATGDKFPITLQEALDHIDDTIGKQDS
jgi:hypothetical protein